VWITGIGLITGLGNDVASCWQGIQRGQSPAKRIDRFDPSAFRSQVAVQADAFDAGEFMDPRTVRQTDRFSQLAIAAGRQAMEDAGLPRESGREVGVYLGSALGGIAHAERQHARFLDRGIRAVAPNLALAVFGGAAPANLGILLGLRGPIVSNANSCASGAVAIGEAMRAVRSGEVDAAIAGGVEAPLSPLGFGAFDLIRALSHGRNDDPAAAARPFDAARDGFVMGEGAALLVLEEAREAERRGARPWAEIQGYGATSDGYHMVQPRPDGSEAARAISRALADAAVEPGEIDYVNAHATSTPLGDVAEAVAIRLALSSAAASVPVSGTKALYGHPLGASGAIEAALCALVIRHGWAPGTVNLAEPAPDVMEQIPALLREPCAQPFRRVLSTAFGFGGLNAALVLGQPG
jgi:3-oxoacyl-[acyl-carrier-protein] synthase II